MATVNVHSFLAEQHLPLVERVEVEGGRWYRFPSETDSANYFASVTNILSVANPKPLVDYFKKTSYRKQTAELEQAADLGTRIHEIVDADLQGEPVGDLKFGDKDLTDWYDRWVKFKTEKQIIAEVLEVPVVSTRWGFAGTADFKGMFMGRRVIADFKSGFYAVKSGFQLSAYAEAWKEMTGETVGLVGLSVPWNKMPQAFEYQHLDWCFNRFLDSLGLFRGLYYRQLDKMKWRYLHVERDGTNVVKTVG